MYQYRFGIDDNMDLLSSGAEKEQASDPGERNWKGILTQLRMKLLLFHAYRKKMDSMDSNGWLFTKMVHDQLRNLFAQQLRI